MSYISQEHHHKVANKHIIFKKQTNQLLSETEIHEEEQSEIH